MVRGDLFRESDGSTRDGRACRMAFTGLNAKAARSSGLVPSVARVESRLE